MQRAVICIAEYGTGNLTSILNVFHKLGIDAKISSEASDIADADRVLLSGVGHFSTCMQRLRASGLLAVLETFTLRDNKPLLGICAGMQMLSASSEEGSGAGLGWIPGRTRRFPDLVGDAALRVPHVGWNHVEGLTPPLFEGLPERPKFYFSHSYYVECDAEVQVIGRTTYGIQFSAAIRHGNIFGTQFHPEKSHEAGISVLRNFAEIC